MVASRIWKSASYEQLMPVRSWKARVMWMQKKLVLQWKLTRKESRSAQNSPIRCWCWKMLKSLHRFTDYRIVSNTLTSARLTSWKPWHPSTMWLLASLDPDNIESRDQNLFFVSNVCFFRGIKQWSRRFGSKSSKWWRVRALQRARWLMPRSMWPTTLATVQTAPELPVDATSCERQAVKELRNVRFQHFELDFLNLKYS